jgi:Na+-translocating ferredoxin:NAD+ oxidoreductase subunit B
MTPSIDALDACLPQTQCTLCGYPDCRSYASALAHGDTDNPSLCVPGATRALKSLCAQLGKDPTLYLKTLTHKPAITVEIDAQACIGCMKCIHACPIDAIIGTGKRLHAVIESDCTGCELCVPKCPVDCIQIRPLAHNDPQSLYQRAAYSQKRYQSRTQRIKTQEAQRAQAHKQAKAGFMNTASEHSINARKKRIQLALKRAQRED